MENTNEYNWPAEAEDDILSGDDFFESFVSGSDVASTKAQLSYLASIVKALVEIRDELRRINHD